MDQPSNSPTGYLPLSTLSSRTNGVLLTFSIVHLVLGCYLLVLGRRIWRVTCALAFALAVELLALALSINIGSTGRRGLNAGFSDADNDLALMGLMLGTALFAAMTSFLLPRRWYVGWWTGWICLGLLGGASVAVSVLLFAGPQLLIESQGGRWALVAVFAACCAIGVVVTKHVGATVASCLIGSWVLALGIDLLVNTDSGSAYGLRVLLDCYNSHRPRLNAYDPPLSTQLTFGLSWLLALAFFGLQMLMYRKRPFLPLRGGAHREDERIQARPLDSTKPPRRRWLCIPAKWRQEDDDGTRDIEKHAEPPGSLAPLADEEPSPIDQSSSSGSSRSTSAGFSTVPDSEIRALTQNYERALANLDSPSVVDGSEPHRRSEETRSIPIYYRPTAGGEYDDAEAVRAGVEVDSQGRRVFVVPVHEDVSDAPRSPTQYDFAHPPQSVPMQRSGGPLGPRPQPKGHEAVQPGGMGLRRADSDRGTSYSVPLTNITNEEYMDRDRGRPPSWVGNLPCDPAMLRGPLDPATLPEHPINQHGYPAVQSMNPSGAHHVPTPVNKASHVAVVTAPRALPQTPQAKCGSQAAQDSAVPKFSTTLPLSVVQAIQQSEVGESNTSRGAIGDVVTPALDADDEPEYELVTRPSLSPLQPSPEVYESRPLISRPLTIGGTGSGHARGSACSVASSFREASLSTAGIAPAKKEKLRAQRTNSREQRMNLGDDDLPDENEASGGSSNDHSTENHEHEKHPTSEDKPRQTSAMRTGALPRVTVQTPTTVAPSPTQSSPTSATLRQQRYSHATDLRSSTLGTPSYAHRVTSSLIDASGAAIHDPTSPVRRPVLMHQVSPPLSNTASVSGATASGSGLGTGTEAGSEASEGTVRPGSGQQHALEAGRLGQPVLTDEEDKRVRFLGSAPGTPKEGKPKPQRRGLFSRQRSGLRG